MRSGLKTTFLSALLVSAVVSIPTATFAQTSHDSPVVHSADSCGSGAKVYSPPAGKPLTAQMLGLPHSNPTLDWAATHHAKWLSTVTCRPGRRHLPASPIKTSPRGAYASYYSSPTWSGYISEGWKQVNDVYSSWSVPTAGAAAPGPTATTQSTWIGTGGWNGQPGALIQEGMESNTAANGSTSYYPWYEIVPDESQQVFVNDPINPGDYMTASLQVTPDDNLLFTKGSFLLCDENPGGVCVSLSQDTKAFETPGTSAEWIIERTIVNSVAPPLTRFGSVEISMDGFYADGASHYEDGAVSINMNSCDGNTSLASVGALYNTNQFLDTWMNYGASEPYPCP